MSTPERTTALLAALKVVLRPLAKAMVARGVTLPALVDALKEVFVDVAERDFEIEGKRSTDSRISILTGVHRKDVRVLRTGGGAQRLRAPALGASATVVGRWLGDPDFQGDDGAPKALPRQSSSDAAVSFDTLVERVSKDVRPRTILDELLRLGVVAHDPKTDAVSLLDDAFVPRSDEAETLRFYMMNLHDHAAAATENLLADPKTPPFLERVVYYSHLSPDSVATLEARARSLASDALIELNREALALQRQDAERSDADGRIRFGAYFYRAPMEDEKAAAPIAVERLGSTAETDADMSRQLDAPRQSGSTQEQESRSDQE